MFIYKGAALCRLQPAARALGALLGGVGGAPAAGAPEVGPRQVGRRPRPRGRPFRTPSPVAGRQAFFF